VVRGQIILIRATARNQSGWRGVTPQQMEKYNGLILAKQTPNVL
jgi:hypothetical protein